jgi:Skp family chaperone for outer membrane proteins
LNNIITISLSFLLYFLPSLLISAHAEDYKLGAVNALRVLEQSPQADMARAKIEQEFAPRDKLLVAEQKKLKVTSSTRGAI